MTVSPVSRSIAVASDIGKVRQVHGFLCIAANHGYIADTGLAQGPREASQQRLSLDFDHAFRLVLGQRAQGAAARRRQHDTPRRIVIDGKIAIFGVFQFGVAGKMKDVFHCRDAVFEVDDAFFLEDQPGGIAHGADGGADRMVGPDHGVDPGGAELVRRRAVIGCWHDHDRTAIVPFAHERHDFIGIRLF
jgi:hypothetical protein